MTDELVSVHCPHCGGSALTEEEDAVTYTRVDSWTMDHGYLTPEEYGDTRTDYTGCGRTINCNDCDEDDIKPVGVWRSMLPIDARYCVNCDGELNDVELCPTCNAGDPYFATMRSET